MKQNKSILEILVQQYSFSHPKSILLLNEKATRNNIIDHFDYLKENIGPKDRLLIYYSGHGHLDSSKKGFWIPTDAKRNSTAQYLRNSTIRGYIETINSKHTLLISDSCFSGTLFVRGVTRSGQNIQDLEDRVSRWGLSSGRHDEEVYDGEPGSNSPFAASIIAILRTNSTDKLNVAKFIDQVIDITRSNYNQLPEGNPLFGVGHMGGQFVFTKRYDEEKDWRAAKNENSINSIKSFLKKYPKGKHFDEAEAALREKVEVEALEAVKSLEESSAKQIKEKLSRLNEWIEKFSNSNLLPDACEFGEQLEQKLAYIESQRSIYSLRKFSLEETPYKEEARKLIENWPIKERKASENKKNEEDAAFLNSKEQTVHEWVFKTNSPVSNIVHSSQRVSSEETNSVRNEVPYSKKMPLRKKIEISFIALTLLCAVVFLIIGIVEWENRVSSLLISIISMTLWLYLITVRKK